MKDYLDSIQKAGLFQGIKETDLSAMLKCIGARKSVYKKDSYIIRVGETINWLMVLLEGQLSIQREDYWGNQNMLNLLHPGDTFGEAYLSPDTIPSLNNVVATKDSVVLFIDINRLFHSCSNACEFHTRTVQNLFYQISSKNRSLVSKLGVVSKRTTRDKLITYLSGESMKAKNSKFEIPFNRQQLADYLSVDRSAMSNELSKMRDEGLLKFHKNQFELLQ